MTARLRAAAAVVAALLGLLALVAGEADDSPGLQGIGLVLIGLAVWALRARR